MELFEQNGHLTEEALRALADGTVLSELQRLEIAEHLAFCDACLNRYTGLLDESVLQTPVTSCEKTIWQKIRLRSLRILTNRYATAAAAVTLVFTFWGTGMFGNVMEASDRLVRQGQPVLSESLQSYTDFLEQTSDRVLSILGGMNK